MSCAICDNPANPFIGRCPHGVTDSRFNQEKKIKPTPGMSEECKHGEYVFNPEVGPVCEDCGEVKLIIDLRRELEQEREKSKEKDRRIEFLKDELFRYRGLPIPAKEKSALDSSREEIERLEYQRNKAMDQLEAERQSTGDLIEALEKSSGLWGAVHAHLNQGARIELETICHVMNRIEAVLARHKAGGKAT